MSELLTAEEIQTLNDARAILQLLEKRANNTHVEDPTKHTAFMMGRIAEAAYGASDAIFAALNCANTYGDVEMTEAQLHPKLAAVKLTTAPEVKP